MSTSPSILSDIGAAPARAGVAVPAAGGGRAVFDVCHAGVVLRTLLFVHGSLAIALLLASESAAAWLGTVSLACAVVLPATLVWLLSMCAGQRRLGRWPRAGRWAAVLGLGAVCGALAGVGWAALRDSLGTASGSGDGVFAAWGAACAGAALAGAVLHWLEQRVRMLESPGTAARLAELQSRIRPHFLFNALNSAIALVEVRPEQAEQVLEDLAELFRAALDDARDQVRLGEELALAQRYLAIEQVRFGERLRLVWQVELAATQALVPPLVLQPLIENAVKHGVEQGAAPGDVEVHVRSKGRDTVEVLIRNRTALMAAEGPGGSGGLPGVARPPVRRGLGMALGNVRERLHLMHDVALHFEAGPAEAGWWQVRIVLPQDAPIADPIAAADRR